MRKTQHHFYYIPAKDANTESNHEETSDKSTVKDTLQNHWPEIFNGVNMMKVKEMLKNCSRPKEAKQMQHLNATAKCNMRFWTGSFG